MHLCNNCDTFNNMDYITESFKGKNKEFNDDFFIALNDEGKYLFVLFDGVSSAKNAKLAIENSAEYIKKNYKYFYDDDKLDLRDLMFETNKHLIKQKIAEAYTTFVALSMGQKKDKIVISSLGDSRIYAISSQYLTQISKDNKGEMSHTITKCLGMKELVRDDFTEIDVRYPEKRFLLCSDGFYSFLEESKSEFFEIMNFNNLKNIKKRISREVENKNDDDATYILINAYV